MQAKNSHGTELIADIASQQLTLYVPGQATVTYPISTAKNGLGEREGSECTPRGWHQVVAKFGDDAPANTVFVGRVATGEIYSPELAIAHPGRDWILTRILWLGGLEPGKNLGGEVDTERRYIYLHGTPDSTDMATPGSHGCLRMRNDDIIELYARVPVGARVQIRDVV